MDVWTIGDKYKKNKKCNENDINIIMNMNKHMFALQFTGIMFDRLGH